MLVKDVMTREVITADVNDTVLHVAQLMAEYNIGSIPVVENNTKVLGMITDRDIVIAMAKYNRDPENTLALNVMTDGVFSVKPEAELSQALELMKKQQIRRLPVIENDSLMGMISLGDIAVCASSADTEIAEALTEISKPCKIED